MSSSSIRRLRPDLSRLATAVSAAALTAILSACGGGGSSPAPEPAVTSVFAQAVKYTQGVVVTINGTNLDQPLSVTTPACPTMTRSTTVPRVSTATTAYYECGNATLGSGQATVLRPSDNSVLGTSSAFTITLPPQVTFTVSNGAGISGQFVVTLASDTLLTPETVSNFLFYVNARHYDGTVFHRVSPSFVAQGGGYLPYTPGTFPTQKINTQPPIDLEVNKGLSNRKWTIAMARLSAPNSATTQFYFNMVDNVALDTLSGGYAVFGHVSSGTDVLATIAASTCFGVNPFGNSDCWPSPNVVITSVVQTRL